MSVLSLDVNVKNIGQTRSNWKANKLGEVDFSHRRGTAADEWHDRSRCRELQSSDICRPVGDFYRGVEIPPTSVWKTGAGSVAHAGKPT